jgi:hypothetical protein
MNIYDATNLLNDYLHQSELANGELISDARLCMTVAEVSAVMDVLQQEIDVRRRRASTGGRGRFTEARQKAWKATQAKGVATRQARALAKKNEG